MFGVKQPCKDCPFRKDSDMRHSLAKGRVEGIIEDLLSDDFKTFTCHKTINYSSRQKTKNQEQHCMGSMVFLQKVGRPHVHQRIAYITGHLDLELVKHMVGEVIDIEEYLPTVVI